MNNGYVEISTLTEPKQRLFKKLFRNYRRVKTVEARLEKEKSILGALKDRMKSWMQEKSIHGIDAGDKVVYLNGKTVAPSFKAVLERSRHLLSEEAVKILEENYCYLMDPRGDDLRLKIRKGKGE